jgi:hypothetical protein
MDTMQYSNTVRAYTTGGLSSTTAGSGFTLVSNKLEVKVMASIIVNGIEYTRDNTNIDNPVTPTISPPPILRFRVSHNYSQPVFIEPGPVKGSNGVLFFLSAGNVTSLRLVSGDDNSNGLVSLVPCRAPNMGRHQRLRHGRRLCARRLSPLQPARALQPSYRTSARAGALKVTMPVPWMTGRAGRGVGV